MPKIRTLRTKKAPKGWELIEPILLELTQKIRDCKFMLMILAQNEATDGKRKPQIMWDIYRLHHQRSRYIYTLYYKKHEISRELYQFCLRERWADAGLIAKWKKAGYERLCCLQCIQNKDHTHGTACICRVPKDDLQQGKLIECKTCGCRGCASGD